jgi:selenocysteine-specific elongation factor
MHVIATAGHVDHGKSTLVQALTGMNPDRLAEERRRGLTIELGYAWKTLPSGRTLAFVDVPGHERFLATMLAGVGPVPAIMFVVAADGGWMPQSAEHLAALDALGVRHGLLVITRADLADPGPALAEGRRQLATTSLRAIPAVAVSAVTGTGLPELVSALEHLADGLPDGDPAAPVRLWTDRTFTVRGSGLVVTGTLDQGRLTAGDTLETFPDRRTVHVRALQSLHQPASSVSAVARVAVNVRGSQPGAIGRGSALLTPGRWRVTSVFDARLEQAGADRPDLPEHLVLHIGAAHVAARVRILAADGPRLAARLTLRQPLPLHVGDVALVRDPGQARGQSRILARVVVLDVVGQSLRRRGGAAALGRDLLAGADVPDAQAILARHGVLHRADLAAMGVPAPPAAVADWVVDETFRTNTAKSLAALVRRYAAAHPLEAGMPSEAARRALGLPDRRLAEWLVAPPLRLSDGRIAAGAAAPALPPAIASAVDRVTSALRAQPFRAPEHADLAALGLDRRAIAAAEKAGRLLRVADGVVLLPDAGQAALSVLRRLPQPFTATQARQALDTTRRVVIPLLEMLDRQGRTERVDDTRRRVR